MEKEGSKGLSERTRRIDVGERACQLGLLSRADVYRQGAYSVTLGCGPGTAHVVAYLTCRIFGVDVSGDTMLSGVPSLN